MEQRHVQNISTLIHFMDGLHDEGFNMQMFTHNCETPSCALGFACTVPALKKEGLVFETLMPWQAGIGSVAAMATDVFGTYIDLFASYLNTHITTPQHWAAHAREYLRKQGHDVLPRTQEQRDDFAAFMDRVMKPVDLVTVAQPT